MAVAADRAQIAQEVAGMNRAEVVDELLHFSAAVALDFTEEFLAKQSVEQLKHILIAARLHLAPQAV